VIHTFFSNKKILILSPQPWNYFFISKHHYALELAKDNDVWFLASPQSGIGWKNLEQIIAMQTRLKVIQYQLPFPALFRFHMKKLYRYVNYFRVKKILNKIGPQFDVCIDFGCYALYDSAGFVKAKHTIFFPVDNFGHLRFTKRGAQHVFTVSDVIRQKFLNSGINCHFINHGLAQSFAMQAIKVLESPIKWSAPEKICIGYSGNLFIRFLNRDIFRQLILGNQLIEFNLFGSTEYNKEDKGDAEWFHFLTGQPNVKLHGFLQPGKLAEAMQKMDALLLCYKADNKDYFGENTHKMLEYLSTGKAIISSHISHYAGSELIAMTAAGNDEALPTLFSEVVKELEQFNTADLMVKRIRFALDNTYEKQIQRIGEIISSNQKN
jgi:glycosyltransferase involved in cell wall biosynthesis